MKFFKWLQFTWDLQLLPGLTEKLPAHYQIAPAKEGDEMALRKIFSSSFLLDPAWNSTIGYVMRTIQSRLDTALTSEEYTCLTLRHGQRIIGAAVLHPQESAPEHFSIGPTLLIEYRNRGLGTFLLHQSLEWLRDAGMNRVSAVSIDYAPVTKFLYPKFGAVMTPVDRTIPLAA